jgi:ribose 5-phosphate isomerase B
MSERVENIAIGSDHAGVKYKALIKKHLESRGIEVRDFGPFDEESVDYPEWIRPVAQAVARGEYPAGIVLGGSGNGEAIVSNKINGIRCAVCWDEDSARLAKEHNNANMISLGERMVSEETALKIVDAWLDAEFQGGRHLRRINQIELDT